MKSRDLTILIACFVLILVAAKHGHEIAAVSVPVPSSAAAISASPTPIATGPILAQVKQLFDPAPATTSTRSVYPRRSNWTLLDPHLSVRAAGAMDLETGVTMYQLNPNERWPLASLSKLMTAVIAIEDVGVNTRVTITPQDLSVDGISGDLQAGQQYTVEQLLTIMLTVSSNRAAMAIADTYGFQEFVDAMQQKASQLGMTQTTYVEPTGLSQLNESTVTDLEKLAAYIYTNHPEIYAITRQPSATVEDLNTGATNTFWNINEFSHTRSDFYGGKTGFTDEAGENLVTLFTYGDQHLLFVVLGTTDDRFTQTEILYNWVIQAFTFHA
ncbi:serine hydrolase [Patescibacteria group bacterium]|nr:serine hydrolase [Patescibacteria group bacterium]